MVTNHFLDSKSVVLAISTVSHIKGGVGKLPKDLVRAKEKRVV